VIAGISFALATLFKHVAVVPAVVIVLTLRRRAWPTLLVIPLLWLLVAGYFAITGRGRIFFDTCFVYPRYYAGNLLANLVAPPRASVELLPLAALALVGLVHQLRSRRWLIPPYLLAAYVAAVLPGQKFAHYLQLLLPPAVLLAGVGAASCRGWKLAVPAVVVVGLIVLQLHWFTASPRDRAAKLHPAGFFLDVADAGAALRELPGTLYVWADEPQAYLLANKRPPAAGLWKMHTVDGPVAPFLAQRTLEMLQRHPPDAVALWTFYPGPHDHPIYRWIEQHYAPLPASENSKYLPLEVRVRK
jgi:hypothetical protein